jgi:hypothetical protein
MIGWGCAVWGSGWYYPPYYWYGGYYPYFRTYGYGAWYNPYSGIYWHRRQNLRTVWWSRLRRSLQSEHRRLRPRVRLRMVHTARAELAQAYNPRTGNYAQTRQGSGVYGSWGSTQVKRGDDWASTKRFTDSARQHHSRKLVAENGGMVNRRGEGFVGKQGDKRLCR